MVGGNEESDRVQENRWKKDGFGCLAGGSKKLTDDSHHLAGLFTRRTENAGKSFINRRWMRLNTQQQSQQANTQPAEREKNVT